MSLVDQAHGGRDIVDGGAAACRHRRPRAEGRARQRVDREQLQAPGGGGGAVERLNREIPGAERHIVPDHEFIAHQHDRRSALAPQPCRGLDRDFGADAVGIADGQGDGRPGHSGSASSVSIRELSHTTVRSFSFTSPSSSL
jgi:hypothetical protein